MIDLKPLPSHGVRSQFRKDLTSGPQATAIRVPENSVSKTPKFTRSGIMTDLEPPPEEERPAELRSAAAESLKRAARQTDPREFDRLTRHALGLIDRARAIQHGQQRGLEGRKTMDITRRT